MRMAFLLAIALPTLTACASTPAPDTPAQFVGCNTNQPLPGTHNSQNTVLLHFTVDESGRPLVGTARFIPTSTTAAPPAAEIQEARQVLAGCVFEPALRDGEPVSSRQRMSVPIQRH